MSSLRQLLNPSDHAPQRDTTDPRQSHRNLTRLCAPSPTDSSSSSSELQSGGSPEVQPEWAHQPHDNCPDSLDCLPDTDGRPQYTLPVILRCVILGSAKKRLTIRDIYAAMEKKYPYYRSAGPAWKQSVRHHLSLSRLFEKVAKPVTDPGFGSYWTVNLDAPPGTKRPRKRGRVCDQVGPSQDGGESPLRRARTKEPLHEWAGENEPNFDPVSPVSTASMPPSCYTSRQHRVHHAAHHSYTTGQSHEEGNETVDALDGSVDDRSLTNEDMADSDDDMDGWDGHSSHPTYTTGPSHPHRDRSFPPASSPLSTEQLQEHVRDLQRQLIGSTAVTERLANELSDAHAEIARLRLRNELLDRGISTGIGQRIF